MEMDMHTMRSARLNENENHQLEKYVSFFKKDLGKNGMLRYFRPASKSISILLEDIDFTRKLPFDPYKSRYKPYNGNDFLVKLLQIHDNQNAYIIEANDFVVPSKQFISIVKEMCKNYIPNELFNATINQVYRNGHNIRAIDNVNMTDGENEIASEVQFSILYYRNDKTGINALVRKLADESAKYGYFLSNYGTYDCEYHDGLKSDASMMYLTFEAKYTLLDIALESNLFHVTLEDSLASIAKNGLLPKAQSTEFTYPPRVFLFNKADYNLILSYGKNKARGHGKDSFYAVRIDKQALEDYSKYKNGELVLYRDPAFSLLDGKTDQTAIFTYNEIPLQLLSNSIAKYYINGNEPIMMKLDSFKKQ